MSPAHVGFGGGFNETPRATSTATEPLGNETGYSAKVGPNRPPGRWNQRRYRGR